MHVDWPAFDARVVLNGGFLSFSVPHASLILFGLVSSIHCEIRFWGIHVAYCIFTLVSPFVLNLSFWKFNFVLLRF